MPLDDKVHRCSDELKRLREEHDKLRADKQVVEQQLRQWQAAGGQPLQRAPPAVMLPPATAPVNRGAYLGVAIRGVSELRPEEAIPGVTSGALVTQVLPNTPGALAGPKDGDVIVSIDGRPVAASCRMCGTKWQPRTPARRLR